jgi:hypothetical protein
VKIHISLELSSVCLAGRRFHGTQTQNCNDDERRPEDTKMDGVVSIDISVPSVGITTLIFPENVSMNHYYYAHFIMASS